MARTTISAFVGLLFLVGSSPAPGALFGTVPNGGNTTLVTIDTSTGAATAVGSIGFADVQGLAGRPADSLLFGGTYNGGINAGQILTIAPAMSSSGTALGSPFGRPIGGMALSPITAVMYATCNQFSATQPDALCTVNQASGIVSPVNAFNSLDSGFIIESFNGLAFNAAGVLYTSTIKTGNPPSEPRLYTVNTSTGIATPVGAIRDGSNVQLNAGVVGLEFVGGILYGSTDDGRILTIDPSTGVYTALGSTGLGTVQGLADLSFVVPPTPTVTPSPTGPTPTLTPGPCNVSAPANPCIPGGGSKKTDCQMEWLVNPVPLLKNLTPVPDVKKGIQRNRLFCYDGDTRCDFDAVKDNNSCTFRVGICINNTDPRFGACTPVDLATYEVKGPNPAHLKDTADTTNLATLEGIGDGAPSGFGVNVYRGKLLVFPGVSNNLPNRCSDLFNAVVPCKQTAGGPRKGKKVIKIKGTNTLNKKDSDSLKLECRPSTCGNGIIETDHETCDDGNRNNGDGCNQACQIEVAPPATSTPTTTPTLGATNTFTQTPTRTPTNVAGPSNTPTDTPTNTPLGNTPTLTPTPTTGPVHVIVQPGGGTAGNCRGVCTGGSRNGLNCGSNVDCWRACAGGANVGQFCTSNANCPGSTCPTTSCGGARTCVGGPLNGNSCTGAANCAGCTLTPQLGSCATVQNTFFPIRVPLNGVCLPRSNPPGDFGCVSNAECKTCIGGANNGKTCQIPPDCPSGTCTGAGVCQRAALDLVVGTPDGNNERLLTIPQSSVILNPAAVTGIGTVCVSAGANGNGVIDCDGGRANLNSLLERDHNTTPGDPGNSGTINGLADDSTCTNTFTLPDSSVSRACIEGTRLCSGGPNAGTICTSDPECPMASCSLCNTGGVMGTGSHPGVCNSPNHATQSGTFAAGDMLVSLPLAIAILATPADFGPDGLACTPDDLSAPAAVSVTLSTGTNTIRIYDANNVAGDRIAPGAICGGSPCIAEITGLPGTCANIIAGNPGGIRFGGGFPALDTPADDIATVFQFNFQ